MIEIPSLSVNTGIRALRMGDRNFIFWDKLIDSVTVNVLLPLRDKLKSDFRYKYISEIDEFNQRPLAEVRQHQLNRLRHIVRIAGETTEFYRERIHDAGIHDVAEMSFEDFAAIEPISKVELRDHQEYMVNRRFRRDALIKRLSGGTTSAPVAVFLDIDSANRRESATASFNAWFGFKPGQKIAYLWAAEQDLPKRTGWKAQIRNRLVERRRFFPSASLDQQKLGDYYSQLATYRPRLFQAYPTPLTELAEFVLNERRTLRLNAISTTAETLYPS
jgi:phenylacetate-coenzyme A ligase PaaK-like adenylate-forming protein